MTASLIYSGGGSQGGCFDPTVDEDMAPMADPLAGLTPPVYAGCDFPDLVEVTTDTILSPGVYCGGIYIYGSANVEFDPGTYIIEGRGLEITGSGFVEGNGVTFYIPPTVEGIASHHHWAPDTSVHFAGSANIELSATTSVDYENVLIYQDAGVSPDLDLVFNGGADMILNGTLYAPNNHLRFAGNNDGTGATSIVANTMYFTGTSSFGVNTETALYGPGGAGGSSLVQ